MVEIKVERRKAQRVRAKLKLEAKLPLAEGQIQPTALETLNISSSGIYFKSDHFIEPMTKLGMVLELPVRSERDPHENEIATVPCEGIVVRVTPEEEAAGSEEYEIAVFFTGIEPEGLHYLEEHIQLLIATD